jgi:hypothetical protein
VRLVDNARRNSSPGNDAQRSSSSTFTWVGPVCTTNWFFATCGGTSIGATSISHAGAAEVRTLAAAAGALALTSPKV